MAAWCRMTFRQSWKSTGQCKMPEIALHILDLVQNSISANAGRIIIVVAYDDEADTLTVIIEDDGCGMSEELLSRVESPFSTTRTTRKVGLGIPMFKQLALMCGGSFRIESKEMVGTRLTAVFKASHVDLPPLGDLPGAVKTLVLACPEKPDFVLKLVRGSKSFVADTAEIRKALGYLPLNEPEIVNWIGEYVSDGMKQVFDN